MSSRGVDIIRSEVLLQISFITYPTFSSEGTFDILSKSQTNMPTEIINVHSHSNDGIPLLDISKEVSQGLSHPVGQKTLPTMLLYDERGLRLYDDITTEVPEYYLFGAEEEILKNNADEIVRAMHKGPEDVSADEVVLELGAG